MCAAVCPAHLDPHEGLCWFSEGHEGAWHKTLTKVGPGWRQWAEWYDEYPDYPVRYVLGMDVPEEWE